MTTEIVDNSGPLSRSLLFRQLDIGAQKALLNLCDSRTIKQGQLLFAQGDVGTAFYVVQSGSLEISVLGGSGRKLTLNVMSPGDCFGEIALLDGGKRTATATAIADSKLLVMSKNRFTEAIGSNPSLSSAIIAILCDRIRWISTYFEERALLPFAPRLASRLVILTDRFATEDQQLRISQSDLANFVGASRESVNKTLVSWRDRGWIELGRGCIHIRDRDALHSLSSQDPF